METNQVLVAMIEGDRTDSEIMFRAQTTRFQLDDDMSTLCRTGPIVIETRGEKMDTGTAANNGEKDE